MYGIIIGIGIFVGQHNYTPPSTPVVDNWILYNGIWHDEKVWNDTKTWKDN